MTIREKRRDKYLRDNFNISLKDYEAIFKLQGKKCAICGRPPKEGKSLNVDHSHISGLIRGLLDYRCNKLGSYFLDNFERMQKAVTYLNTPPASAALGADRFGYPGRTGTKKQRKLRKKLKKLEKVQKLEQLKNEKKPA